ncbi:Hypothetical protein Minf_0998 [Methylacidiphilum infernorum V4]|uniref:Uncharacterized protein n=1 Tax=Methylacidiphilum infernorum (isolate V4) TaxID=481448 RepID=B3DUQ0_METI4|nr:Hypothetical protein Minf_0998 [Methylacidiphilum infernorum V4]
MDLETRYYPIKKGKEIFSFPFFLERNGYLVFIQPVTVGES